MVSHFTQNLTMPFLSQTDPIPQTQYEQIPFKQWTQRQVAHEEAKRDLDKSAEQLLVDIHDESLDRQRPPHETISRTMARLASMQLRTQIETDRLADETSKLNKRLYWLSWIVLALTIASTVAGVIQAYYSRASYLWQIRH